MMFTKQIPQRILMDNYNHSYCNLDGITSNRNPSIDLPPPKKGGPPEMVIIPILQWSSIIDQYGVADKVPDW